MARFVPIAAVCLMAGVAHADRVHLANGAVIEGKAAREGDRVVVEIESGRFAISADQVARIEPGTSPVQRFEQRRAGLGPRDVAGRLELANYCRDHGMRAQEQELLREIIELSADHAEARARLGYVRQGPIWIERDEALRAQGLVQFEGRWLTRAQVLELERLRAEARVAADEAEAAARQREKAEAELAATKAEIELRKQEAATAKAEADAAQAAQPVYFWPAPYAFTRYSRACPGPGCQRRVTPKPRPDGRPPWPIVGTKDPFDYLR